MNCKSVSTSPIQGMFPLPNFGLVLSFHHRRFHSLLLKCASTSMSSKLIHSEKPFFSKMVVEAIESLDQDDLDDSLIGVKKIAGGGLQDSLLVKGVAFKK